MAQKVKIQLPDDKLVISDEILLGQIIEFKGKQFLVDLIVFYMVDFDMILGWIFLRRNKVELSVQESLVWFSLEDRDQFKFN